MNGIGAALLLLCGSAVAASDCSASASADCYFAFEPAGAGGRVHYYASQAPGAAPGEAAPTHALIALHGHSRDANQTFEAALSAVQGAGAAATTLVVAPVFQVEAARAGRCRTAGVPAAQAGDLVWTCASWADGGQAQNGNAPTSFAVMDALVAELVHRWPTLRVVTVAGFSAGAQLVQRYIGFANTPSTPSAPGPTLRYVVADPGSWLYFDAKRPRATPDGKLRFVDPAGDCPAANRWKYGLQDAPPLGRTAAEARARYAEADIHYLEGALDTGEAPGAAFKVLDRSCAANAQGPYRLQRGLAYAQYDQAHLATTRPHPLTVVPGCAHEVGCVFPSSAARAALFGLAR